MIARQLEIGGTSQVEEREGTPIVNAGDRPSTTENVDTAPPPVNAGPPAQQQAGNPGQAEFASNANDLFRRFTAMLATVEQRRDREVIDIRETHTELEDNQKVLEEFMKLNPSEYDEEPNVDKVNRWIEFMEKSFETMSCSEKQMVISTTFKLQEASFLALVQGDMTIAQYEARYSVLARYNPHLIPNEAAKARRFVEKLRDEFRTQLVGLRLTKYFEAVKRSYDIENGIDHNMMQREQIHRQTGNDRQEQSSRNRQTFGKRTWGSGNLGRFNNNRGSQVRQGDSSRQQRTRSTATLKGSCDFCGKKTHTETEFWKKQGKCLGCGATDHQALECPRWKPVATSVQGTKRHAMGMKRSREGRPKTRGRVLYRTQQEALDSTNVHGGIFNILCT